MQETSDKGPLSKTYRKKLRKFDNKKMNNLILKMGKKPEQTPHQRYTEGKQANGKLFKIMCHGRVAN